MADKAAYNPAAGIRGIVSNNESPVGDFIADHAGKASRHQTFGLWLECPGKHIILLYGHLSGAPEMNLAATVIEIPFSGRQPKNLEIREWTATIEGKRLGKVWQEISEGKRMDIHCCKDWNDDKPYVSSVTVEAVQDDDGMGPSGCG